MTGPELDAALARIGWGRLTLAKRLGVSCEFIRNQAVGRTRVHPDVAAYVAELVVAHDGVPVPGIAPRVRGARIVRTK